MSEVEGKNLVCDVCGRTVFLKYVKTEEYDGGFTKIRRYEDKPDGWGSMLVWKYRTLCPSCNERMQEALLACVSGISCAGTSSNLPDDAEVTR